MCAMIDEQGQDCSIIRYQILKIQYVQGKQKITPQKNLKNNKIKFANITEEGIELRAVIIEQITSSSFEQLRLEDVLRHSILEDFIQFEDVIKVDKKVHGDNKHCIIGIFGSKKEFQQNKPWIVIRLQSEDIMDECYDEINNRLKQQKEYIKKSVINYIGIEENVRKIIQKILINSPGKRQIYGRISQKIREKGINLTREKNKMMMYALMGNHPDMQNFIRKQKIEAYDLEKRKYDQLLKEDNIGSLSDLGEGNPGLILEGYSERKKMDGIIARRRAQKEQREPLNNRNFEELYIQKIPYRQQYQIDELIGIQKNIEEMQIEERVVREAPVSYRADKVKIPVKDYSIICKEPEWYRTYSPGQSQELDLVLKTAIEAVKFMYQLMRINSLERRKCRFVQGPLDGVLDCLKDILTECGYREDEQRKEKKQIENKSVLELLHKVSKNYLEYRKNPNKFY